MIPPERIILYARALSDLSEKQLAHGFEKALKYFKPEFGKSFPTPAEIRAWAYEYRPVDVIQDSRHILDRGDKPPDWEPLEPGELEAMKQRAQTIERKVQEAAKPMEMPKGPDAEEWERRRQAQLRAFREKNREAGEA
jgi:hypothetical protein